MARPTKWTEEMKQDNPLVSFRISAGLKSEIEKTADRHGRTQGEQMVQSIKDGLVLQSLIKKASNSLIETRPDLSEYLGDDYKPSEADCLLFISEAVNREILRRKSEMRKRLLETLYAEQSHICPVCGAYADIADMVFDRVSVSDAGKEEFRLICSSCNAVKAKRRREISEAGTDVSSGSE